MARATITLTRRDLLRILLEQDNEAAAAECLRQPGKGVITLPQSLANTRDGREEAIQALQEAFEHENIGAIVIERGR